MNQFGRFLITGAGGAALSLLVTWSATTFVFGQAGYFNGYLLGIAANLVFNFLLYTVLVFQTKRDHARRLVVFAAYALVMAFFQASVVRVLVNIYGTQYYLELIALVIASLAILNFFVFRLSIFKEHEDGTHIQPHAILSLVCLMAVLVRLGTFFHALSTVGLKAIIYGDAIGYRQLAQHIASGAGFVNADVTGVWVPELFRTPGFPLLLAPFAGTNGGTVLYLILLGVLSGIALPYLTYRISSRFMNAGPALIAAGLAAFEPQLVFFGVLPQTEMPFILFSYTALYIGLVAYARRSYLLAVASGVFAGYAAFIRPGFWPVYVVCMLGLLAYLVVRVPKRVGYAACMLAFAFITLVPWYLRIHEETGTYALSAAGWRNVYTDYLASVRATENHTDFASEKRKLKGSVTEAGVDRADLDNPASARALRNYALKELWQKKKTVLTLEPILLQSFFLQDGYYYQFRRLGLIPPDEGGHVSATFTLLTHGLAGIPIVFQELARQRFMPIIGHVVSISVFLFGLLGLITMKHRIRYFFFSIIALSALTATVIGLGIEERLRLPVEPLLFLFAAYGVAWAGKFIHIQYARRHSHSGI